jgi:hypothetical protein
MRHSNFIGWCSGWILNALFHAWDVGSEDPLFVPALVLGVPGVMGLVAALVSWRKTPTPLSPVRVLGFGALGGVVGTLVIVAIIAFVLQGLAAPTP